MRNLAVGVLLLLIAGPACAGPLTRNANDLDHIGWFYNRPGATPDNVESDLRSCTSFANSSLSLPSTMSLGQMIGGSIVYGLGNIGAGAKIADDCMMSLGYRRFNTVDANRAAFQRRYESMDEQTRDALANFDRPPEGTLARAWDDTIWHSSPTAPHARRHSVLPSVLASLNFPVKGVFPLRENQSIEPHEGDAVIVVTLEWDSDYVGLAPGVQFASAAPGGDGVGLVPYGSHQRPTWVFLNANIGPKSRLTGAPWTTRMVFVAPAGHYALSTINGPRVPDALAFCMGTIGFNVSAGAVVDLGVFTIEPPRAASDFAPATPVSLSMRPPDLDADRSSLARTPELASKLESVSWIDGVRIPCNPDPARVWPPWGIDLPATHDQSLG